jgi:glycosyltransferase involved in cell wall biosynthesis
MRVTVLALHFAEYSYRLAVALANEVSVQLVVDPAKLTAEAPYAWADLERQAVRVCHYKANSRRARVLSAPKVFARVAGFKPNLVIAHEQSAPLPALITAAVSLMAPTRLIVHDPAPHAGFDTQHRAANWRYVDLVRRLAKSFIVHGRFCHDELVSVSGRSKPIQSVAHGILSPPRTDQLKNPIPGRVLFFGRLELYKGLRTLFAAADQLALRLPHFSLLILGRGSELEAVREMADERPHVMLEAGFASADRVVSAMQESQVIALPYDEASQSGVLAVAFANGRPVVATAVGSITESVPEDAGLLVPPHDPDAFAEALYACLTDRETSERLSHGAATAAEREMSWRSIARKLLELPP